MVYLMVALGGGLGSASRLGIARLAIAAFGEGMPFGTLLVNALGSFFLGVVFEFCAGCNFLGVDARLPLGTGFAGGFTTYSSFSVETINLVRRGDLLIGASYAAGTTVLCLAAAAAGLTAGRAFRG